MIRLSIVLSPQQDSPMFSVEPLLAILAALAISVVLALCLPTWASLCIALVAVVTVAVGGGALLAQVSAVGCLIALAAWLARTCLRRRAKRMAAEVKWLAIPEVQRSASQAPARRSERRAA
jgi:hypothetical protein